MKNAKKIPALLLVAVMVVTTLAACKKEVVNPYAELTGDYDAQSAAVYEDILGGEEGFAAAYEAAKTEATSVSERYALAAIAEAKLMESAVMLPLSSNGGNYAISRVVPNTAASTLWGNDSYRYHNVLVATTPLTSEHRAQLKAMWAERKGTGTWEASAEKFMTDNGYTLKNTYSLGYASDPQTWDVLGTSRAADSQAIVNTYDGLVAYDSENRMMPALAERWEASPDGLTYTFKIRQGLKWVDSQGREVADVKADDFVAGMQHMMDAMAGLEYLVQDIIVNASEYIAGDVVDFAQVGVKAVDDATLQYTLCQETPYFMTMLGYGVFAPMSREYYISQGGQFGADFDSSADSYTYGKTPDNIAYCGPYTVSNATAENTIVFKANPAYWNAANVNMETITWLYNDGEDATKAFKDTVAGVLDGAVLNASSLAASKSEPLPAGYVSANGNTNWYDEFHYISATDATTFSAFYNVNRSAFANVNDGAVASTKTDEEKVRTTVALQNVHFRRALSFAADRATYNAMTVGEDLKLTSLRNSYTPGTFVYLEEDVTVDINGTAATFPAGTFYGAIMQAQIDADGVAIKVWDPQADGGIGSSDGFDGWYNPEEAVKELEVAVKELKSSGVTINEKNPIYIDLPYFSGSEAYGNRANAYKQGIETVLGGSVIVNLVECVDSAAWYYAGYYTEFGNEGNYDMYDVSGWGPDYGDPATYLDTFLDEYAGYMVKCIGIY